MLKVVVREALESDCLTSGGPPKLRNPVVKVVENEPHESRRVAVATLVIPLAIENLTFVVRMHGILVE